MHHFDVLGFHEHRDAPVEDSVTDGVNKKVGCGENPDVRVAKDVLVNESFKIVSGTLLRCFNMGAFNLRQTD